MTTLDLTRSDLSSVDIFINSSSRTQGIAEDFTYIIGDAPLSNILGYRINDVKIPNTVYLVETGETDTHILNEGGPDLTVTIAEGFYSDPTTLAAAWKTALDSASTLPQVYTVTWNAITEKFTVTAGAAFSFNFTPSPFGVIVGYPRNAITASNTTQTSTNVATLISPNLIHISSSSLSNSTLAGHSIENHAPSNIIATVVRSQNNGTTDLYELSSTYTTLLVAVQSRWS